MANSQNVHKPDFSMPKTVSKEAKADLKKAEKSGDAHVAINALLRLSVAESLIDPEEMQTSIKTVEDVAPKFKGDKLYGLFPALLARMYSEMYYQQQWKYNSRELPLTPYPADLTEWSGQQFKTRISELYTESYTGECADGLKECQLADYKDIIEVGHLTTVYYPTLLDFAFQNAYDIHLGNPEADEVVKAALASSPYGSAPYILWLTCDNTLEPMTYGVLYDKCKKLADNQYAGIIIDMLGSYVNVYDDDCGDSRSYVGLAEEYISKYPETPFKNDILNNIDRCRQGRLAVTFPSYTAVGRPIEIKVSDTNAKKYALDIYYAGENDIRNGKDFIKKLRALKPWKTINLTSGATDDLFVSTDTTKVTFDTPGYYYVLPRFDKDNDENQYYSLMSIRCLPVMPYVIKNDYIADVITVDPYDGAPIEGVKVSIYNRNSAIEDGTSDQNGITDIFGKGKDNNSYKLKLGYGGKTYDFDNINVYFSKNEAPTDAYNANILTDRAIYHPGDSVNVVVVVAKAFKSDGRTETSVCKGYDIKIELKDVNYKIVKEETLTTDDMGRATTSFSLPSDGLTGSYTINVRKVKGDNSTISVSRIMVSDYRMPEFEVKISEVACDVPQKGYATIKGNATSYSGMPMGDANVTLILSETSWGWWRWRSEGQKLYSAETVTAPDGCFSFVVPDTVLTSKTALYKAKIDVVSITGSPADASTSFTMSKRYDISLVTASTKVDGEKPFTPEVKVYAPDGSETEIALKWMLVAADDTVASGIYTGEVDLTKVKPATYNFVIAPEDPDLAEPAMASITVYNRASGIVPNDAVLFIPCGDYTVDGQGKANIEYAVGHDDTYIYYSMVTETATTPVTVVKANAGYHTLCIQLPPNADDAKVYMYIIKNCSMTTEQVSLRREKATGLRIEGESFRDNLVPGSKETWNIRVVGADGTPMQTAVALDMYNKALESLAPHAFNLSRPAFWQFSGLSANYIYNRSGSVNLVQKIPSLKEADLMRPYFMYMNETRDYVMPLYNSARSYMVEEECCEEPVGSNVKIRGIGAMMTQAGMAPAAMNDAAVAKSELSAEAEAVEESAPEIGAFDYRDSDVPMAVWAPMLTTDANGCVQYTFTVPNTNTTWRLRAVAWSKDMEIGAMMRDFVASKPVMVQPNLPRFLRTGDTATILASVMNNTDTVQTVTTTVEIFDPLTQDVMKSKTFTQTIGAKESDKVAVNIYVDDDASAIGYRVRSSNGTFADGEQSVIRVLTSQASLIETTPFYLNPGDSIYSVQLPKEENARISLTFCENPAWTIVSALPGLREEICDYANSAAAALYSASIAKGIIKDNPKIAEALKEWRNNPSDSALVSMLQKNEDLKIAVLNSTPWVQAAQSDTERMANLALIFDEQEVSKSITAALKILTDLQRQDGGWAWGKWCDESSVWVTANVLDMLGQLRRLNWLPANAGLGVMIDNALKYYDDNVKKTDIMYCIVRPMFDAQISGNGQNVIRTTCAEIKKNWKNYTDPAYKAMAAQALYLNGYKDVALKLMASVSEFGVFTKDQGLKFPSVNALYSYGILLDAYAMMLPDSKEVDGLRQQLIVRKQATDWGNAVVTTEVIKAILSTGTCWTVDAKGAEVKVGDTVIGPSGAIETATGFLRADLSDYAGEELMVTTTGAGPAYGAIYAQFDRQMDEVKAYSCDDLDIEKRLYVRRGVEWAVADSLQVGDRVKVQLTIHSKRSLQYVTIIDERPAAFEPVEQLPGWLWSEGVGFYRENRDTQTDMHVVYMAPGTYLLTYEMNVNVAGCYSSGVATIQSQYAPELSAHSSGCKISVKQ